MPGQNGRHFADGTFKRIFLNETVRISIEILLKFVPMGPINITPALIQIMAWRRPGDKPLSEPMGVRLPTLMLVTRAQWTNFMIMRSYNQFSVPSWELHIVPVVLRVFDFAFGQMEPLKEWWKARFIYHALIFSYIIIYYEMKLWSWFIKHKIIFMLMSFFLRM